MPSSFGGVDIFGSGPHRFTLQPQGLEILEASQQTPAGDGPVILGTLELRVEVRGRLTGTSEAQLWQRRDAIAALITDPPQQATLDDGNGRQWEDMSLARFEELGPIDRGRERSLAYRAVFRRLA